MVSSSKLKFTTKPPSKTHWNTKQNPNFFKPKLKSLTINTLNPQNKTLKFHTHKQEPQHNNSSHKQHKPKLQNQVLKRKEDHKNINKIPESGFALIVSHFYLDRRHVVEKKSNA